jgi:hypothetical protein
MIKNVISSFLQTFILLFMTCFFSFQQQTEATREGEAWDQHHPAGQEYHQPRGLLHHPQWQFHQHPREQQPHRQTLGCDSQNGWEQPHSQPWDRQQTLGCDSQSGWEQPHSQPWDRQQTLGWEKPLSQRAACAACGCRNNTLKLTRVGVEMCEDCILGALGSQILHLTRRKN